MVMIRISGTKLIFFKKQGASFASFLPLLFFLANLYRLTGHSVMPYFVTLYAAGVFGLLKLLLDKKCRNPVFFLFFGVYMLSGILNGLVVGNSDYNDFFLNLLLFGVTVTMFAYPMTYLQGVVFFYISIAAFLPAYFGGISTGLVLTSSGNYISVLLVLTAAMYYIALQNSGRAVRIYDLFPALLSYLLSIWGRGRGGIVACLFLFVMMMIYYGRHVVRKKNARFLIAVLVLFAVAAVVLIGDVDFLDYFMNLGKWRTRGTDNTARLLIWDSYFDKMGESAVYVFGGAPLDEIPRISAYGGNTHNSFLQLHATNGVLNLVFVFVLFVYALVHEVRHGQTMLAIALLTLFIRGMTDKFIFGQYGMPVMLYLVFYPFYSFFVKRKAVAPEGIDLVERMEQV